LPRRSPRRSVTKEFITRLDPAYTAGSYIQRIAPATSAPVQSSSATTNRARGKRRVVASRPLVHPLGFAQSCTVGAPLRVLGGVLAGLAFLIIIAWLGAELFA
jgi:hypothetical protein